MVRYKNEDCLLTLLSLLCDQKPLKGTRTGRGDRQSAAARVPCRVYTANSPRRTAYRRNDTGPFVPRAKTNATTLAGERPVMRAQR
ncbi:unnamed protein product, partial [Iphiclides podalirius]